LQALVDMGHDVLEPFGERGVAVVGIAVQESPADVELALERAGAGFPQLLDESGDAASLVGSTKLPRIYVLDPQGKVVWFDIEYSLATRRELHQVMLAITRAE
jgi:peroxiredoxin